MEKIIEELDNLKKAINETETVKEIKRLNKKVNEEKDLKLLINEYKNYPNDKLKNDIINNKLFQEYKEKELDINILIMKINKELKRIKKEGHCNL